MGILKKKENNMRCLNKNIKETIKEITKDITNAIIGVSAIIWMIAGILAVITFFIWFSAATIFWVVGREGIAIVHIDAVKAILGFIFISASIYTTINIKQIFNYMFPKCD